MDVDHVSSTLWVLTTYGKGTCLGAPLKDNESVPSQISSLDVSCQ